MKTIKSYIWILTLLVIYSCGSDNLSNSKAKKIISECLEKEPIKRSISLQVNTARFLESIKDSDFSKYEKLKEDGFIEMVPAKINAKKPVKGKSNDPLSQWRYEAELRRYNRNYKNAYDVKLTDKAEKYIENAPKNSNNVKMKAFIYEVNKVLEVQEIPAMNTAKVKVQYKAVDVTPFAILSRKDPSEFWVKDLTMTKTSNGWKYCDNF